MLVVVSEQEMKSLVMKMTVFLLHLLAVLVPHAHALPARVEESEASELV